MSNEHDPLPSPQPPPLTLVPPVKLTTQERLLDMLQDGQENNLEVLREVSSKLSELNTNMQLMHADMRGVRQDLNGVTDAVKRLESTPHMMRLVVAVGVIVGLATLAAAGINVRASYGKASFTASPVSPSDMAEPPRP